MQDTSSVGVESIFGILMLYDMWYFARFGTIWSSIKSIKNTRGGMLLLVESQAIAQLTILHGF